MEIPSCGRGPEVEAEEENRSRRDWEEKTASAFGKRKRKWGMTIVNDNDNRQSQDQVPVSSSISLSQSRSKSCLVVVSPYFTKAPISTPSQIGKPNSETDELSKGRLNPTEHVFSQFEYIASSGTEAEEENGSRSDWEQKNVLFSAKGKRNQRITSVNDNDNHEAQDQQASVSSFISQSQCGTKSRVVVLSPYFTKPPTSSRNQIGEPNSVMEKLSKESLNPIEHVLSQFEYKGKGGNGNNNVPANNSLMANSNGEVDHKDHGNVALKMKSKIKEKKKRMESPSYGTKAEAEEEDRSTRDWEEKTVVLSGKQKRKRRMTNGNDNDDHQSPVSSSISQSQSGSKSRVVVVSPYFVKPPTSTPNQIRKHTSLIDQLSKERLNRIEHVFSQFEYKGKSGNGNNNGLTNNSFMANGNGEVKYKDNVDVARRMKSKIKENKRMESPSYGAEDEAEAENRNRRDWEEKTVLFSGKGKWKRQMTNVNDNDNHQASVSSSISQSQSGSKSQGVVVSPYFAKSPTSTPNQVGKPNSVINQITKESLNPIEHQFSEYEFKDKCGKGNGFANNSSLKSKVSIARPSITESKSVPENVSSKKSKKIKRKEKLDKEQRPKVRVVSGYFKSSYQAGVDCIILPTKASKASKASDKLSEEQKQDQAYKRRALDNTWIPPRSPFGLLQEDHAMTPGGSWSYVCFLIGQLAGRLEELYQSYSLYVQMQRWLQRCRKRI
ncbi:hypothetical protein NMG60_11006942 [Bertholletia excelsa]